MSVSTAIKPLFTKKVIWIVCGVLITGIVVWFIFLRGPVESVVSTVTNDPQVTLTSANEFLGGESLSLIGSVRAFTEAAVTAERSGRVVQVNATLGQTVGVGQVLATLENSAESAAILQAEGVYDSAVAARAQAAASQLQSAVGVDESQTAIRSAENAALSAYKSAYTTVNGVILNNVDQFFSSPNGFLPGLKIAGYGETDYLNQERVVYQELLPAWQQRANTLSVNDNLPAALREAESNLSRTLAIVDTFVLLFNRQDNNSRYSDEQLNAFSTSFNGLRSQLTASKDNLDAAQLALENAQDTSTRADIDVSVSTLPAADAQIKQALGSLRSAQASYAKTILRTPIAGTVNEIAVKAGDYVTASQQIAEVANNNALEIVTYVSDLEVDLLSVGDTVQIEGQYEGTITQIAPSVDATTRKTEVRIATENTAIKNGDTVTITKEIQETENATEVIVPLTAVKFELEDGYVFTVVDNVLQKNPVKLGVVRGSSVAVLEGLTLNQEFVADGRGLTAGDRVTLTQ